jgi:hypothetical protein
VWKAAVSYRAAGDSVNSPRHPVASQFDARPTDD